MRTGIATAMVAYAIGELVGAAVRAMAVKPYYKWFTHDGAYGPNVATVYSDRGYGVCAPVVFYNRSNEAAAQLKPGDFDWRAFLSGGVRWFQSSGIYPALSDSTAELVIEAMKAAKDQRSITSFDVNYREKLWNASGGRARALSVLHRILPYVDVLVANEEDLQNGLGIAGPSIRAGSSLDSTAFLEMIAQVIQKFPQLKVLATTLREVHSANRHTWSAAAWIKGYSYVAPTCDLDVYERIGGGDGFAADPALKPLLPVVFGTCPHRVVREIAPSQNRVGESPVTIVVLSDHELRFNVNLP
jgi:2-dehydro-3-deoxygluconokinase